MKSEKPKVIAVFKEMDLIAQEIHLKLRAEENDNDGSEVYTVEPDPGVTETITCTDCVCSTTEAKFLDRVQSFQVRAVLPKSIKPAESITITMRKSSK